MSELNNDLPGYGYDDMNNNSSQMNNGYGYDVFGNLARNTATDENTFNPDYTEPYGLEGLKTIATEKVVSKSFIFMFVALLITAFAALTTTPKVAYGMMTGGSFWILFIAEIAIVLISNKAISNNNVLLAGVLYTIYSFLTGMTCSVLFLVYTASSITGVFVITAVMFGTMAVFGLVTHKDLTTVGSICFMGLWGIIIASIVNLFILKSGGFDLIVSIIGVLVFVGLTAYDTQKIKQMCAYSTTENENAIAMFGAFQLYLDFINLFLKLLRILGRRK